MARKPQVTRTIQTTEVLTLCLDINEQKPFEKMITVSGVYKDTKQLTKKLSEIIDTDSVKFVHIKSAEVKETLYGMSEDDFIAHAKQLPPRKITK